MTVPDVRRLLQVVLVVAAPPSPLAHAIASAFDAVLRNHLQATTGAPPWPP